MIIAVIELQPGQLLATGTASVIRLCNLSNDASLGMIRVLRDSIFAVCAAEGGQLIAGTMRSDIKI
jgi:hypothetical protein